MDDTSEKDKFVLSTPTDYYLTYEDAKNAGDHYFNHFLGKPPTPMIILDREYKRLDDLSMFSMLIVAAMKRKFMEIAGKDCEGCKFGSKYTYHPNQVNHQFKN